ncbi:protein translocase subunit SecD [candidate division WOR-3 bacterium]|nr:protein translocase subunit SecD [candidate division WOR-3 bacterium]
MKSLKWKWLFIFIVILLAIWQLHYSWIYFSRSEDELSRIPAHKREVIESRALHLGLDLKGGMHMVLKIDKSKLKEEEIPGALDRALEIVRNRIDQFGVSEPDIRKQGTDKMMVDLPGVIDRDRAREILGRTALLEFKSVAETSMFQNALNSTNDYLKGCLGDTFNLFSYFIGQNVYGIISPYKTYIDSLLTSPEVKNQLPYGYVFQWGKEVIQEGYRYYPLYLLKEVPLLTGSAILDARHGIGTQDNPAGVRVDLTMTRGAAAEWAQITGAHVGRRIAIVLDGIVQSAPGVRERIPNGRSVITLGNVSMEDAKTLAIVLRAGALPAPLEIIEERSIGPSLGLDSITAGARALILGSILVFLFIVAYYRKTGVVAIFALILNIGFLLAVLSGLRATLTLPGLAGIVLTVGAAIDANVLIFERIREELAAGKTIRTAIVSGYERVFSTILDANATTFIAAIILFYFGTGPIKGFAITLSIGLAASFFTAIFVTRNVFEYWTLKGLKEIKMFQIFRKPNFDFINTRKVAFIFSGVLIFSGIVSLAAHKGPNYGIDFTGGRSLEVEFTESVSSEEMRIAVSSIGFTDASIQKYTGKEIFILKIKETGISMDKLKEELSGRFKDKGISFPREEKVGAAISKGLQTRAFWVLLLGMIGILIYVSIRFTLRFAVAAVVALLHDLLITVGILSLTNTEFNIPIIAGLLTILGYSINDSIVISDRIRENTKLLRGKPYDEIVNRSINNTLSRTIITSVTTLFVLFSLYFMGGRILHGFSFTMLIGVIIGTYSSIFIVAPIVAAWERRSPARRV